MLKQLIKDLEKLADPQKSANSARYFKTGAGQYGEGDFFYGITVPETRIVVKKNFRSLDLDDVEKLLLNKYHEQRLTGLLVLVAKYKIANEQEKKSIFDFYMAHTKNINNWDLVDTSAPYIVGEYLLNRDKSILYTLAKSDNLWEKRISIIATLFFIKYGFFDDTLKLCKVLIGDSHDLIHKATGWCLREVGKKDEKILTEFLDENISNMPRTMLRYAIEKFDEDKRKHYLNIK
ncbi:MAG: DNA alkylation repair protein [Candidatus Gracilibacteria bacterium]|nr:DNA alkylation repair protein [Candidatus Gracilibacteria bacterium]